MRTLLSRLGLALAGAALCVGAISAQASETLDRIKSSGELRVGTGIYPPYTIQNPDGSITGLEAELFELLAKDLGVELRYIPVGWDLIAAGVGTGKYDMTTGLLISEERLKVVDYARTPLYTVGQVWLVKADNPKNPQSLEDLNDADITVIVTTGGYEDAATTKTLPNATIKRVPGINVAQQVVEVMAGRADAAPVETPLNTALFKEEYGDQIRYVPDVDHPAIEVASSWTLQKGDTGFQDYLTAFLDRVIADGTMQALKDKYLQKQYIAPE